MRPASTRTNVLLYCVSLLYVLLFLYAAVSKLLDYDNFVVQIGQSPLLSAYAGTVSWAVPVIEILIAIGLMIEPLRKSSLIAGYILMMMFSAYIVIIMKFASFVPCSCGGILEDMSWEQHLVFNLGFCLLAALALVLESRSAGGSIKPITLRLAFSSLAAPAVIALLFVASEDQMRNRNSFVRRFPVKAPIEPAKCDIGFSTYYFAGVGKNEIYLGNTTAPRHVLIVSKDLRDKRSVTIEADKGSLAAYAPRLKVNPPHFYIFEGNIPFVFKGNTADWKADGARFLKTPFTLVEPVANNQIVFRSRNAKTDAYQLETLNLNDNTVKENPALLQKQIDGVFDSDGMLVSDGVNLAYIYYYRNQAIRMTPHLDVLRRIKTIDTVSKARIKVFSNPKTKEVKLGGAPLFINRLAAIDGRYLFINSPRVGKYEPEEMFKAADIIDIYDTQTGRYVSSFYYYREKGISLKGFIVRDRTFFGIQGSTLSTIRLNDKLFE